MLAQLGSVGGGLLGQTDETAGCRILEKSKAGTCVRRDYRGPRDLAVASGQDSMEAEYPQGWDMVFFDRPNRSDEDKSAVRVWCGSTLGAAECLRRLVSRWACLQP